MVDTGREAGDCNDGRKTKAMQENEKIAWGGKAKRIEDQKRDGRLINLLNRREEI